MDYFAVALAFVVSAVAYLIWRAWFKKEFVEPEGLAVFISGCDTGLGHRLAVYFDSLGCDVFAGCLNPDSARETLPDSVTVVPLNICLEDSVKEAVKTVEQNLIKKDKNLWAVINNAGVCVYGEFEWQTWNQCQKQVEVNLLGTMRLTKAFIPLLRKSKGRIVTVTSVNGSIAYPGLSVYSATKFALEGFNHAIRLELRRQHGIKVIIVEPGDYARLTSIMSQHEKNAEEMWNNMPTEDQEKYGNFFRMYHRVTMKNYGLTSPPSFEDSPLLNDMKDGLFNTNPQVRYISAKYLHKLFYQLLTLMPLRLVDRIFDKITDTLFDSDKESTGIPKNAPDTWGNYESLGQFWDFQKEFKGRSASGGIKQLKRERERSTSMEQAKTLLANIHGTKNVYFAEYYDSDPFNIGKVTK